MKNNQKISILIITRNRKNELEDCLHCLRQQTVLPDQIVIVEDCTENQFFSRKSLQSLFSSKTHCEYIKIMRGNYAKSRNIALRKANGSIIIFLDDDILFDPEYIKNVVRLHSKYPSIFGFIGTVYPAIYTPFSFFTCLQMNDEIWNQKSMSKVRFFAFPAISFKSKIIKKVAIYFDETITTGEDVLFLQEYYKRKHPIYFHPALKIEHKFVTTLTSFTKKQFTYALDFGKLAERGASTEYLHYFPNKKIHWFGFPFFIFLNAHRYSNYFLTTFSLSKYYYPIGVLASFAQHMGVYYSNEGRQKLINIFWQEFSIRFPSKKTT